MDKLLNKASLHTFWPGFLISAYALYTDKTVWLFNHPLNEACSTEPLEINRTGDFLGDTLILYKDVPTAIVSLERYPTELDYIPLLIHELFHGFQYAKKEQRFPDELVAITYPLTPWHVAMRRKERQQLFNAWSASTEEDVHQALTLFFSCRAERQQAYPEAVDFEQRIETIEGPALYMEQLMVQHINNIDEKTAVNRFLSDFLDPVSFSTSIRKSCYAQGMLLCLLFDRIKPNWKLTFLESDVLLSTLLLKQIPFKSVSIQLDSRETAENAINLVLSKKEKRMSEFHEQNGYLIKLSGSFSYDSFDPMNICSTNNKWLHPHHVQIRTEGKSYTFKQSVLAEHDELNKPKTLYFFSTKQPSLKQGQLIIPGIGDFCGSGTLDGSVYSFTII